VLEISNIGLGKKGTHSFANALRENTSLTVLNISNNSMKDVGLEVLMDVMKGNRSITK
jgi:hypothetical protein